MSRKTKNKHIKNETNIKDNHNYIFHSSSAKEN